VSPRSPLPLKAPPLKALPLKALPIRVALTTADDKKARQRCHLRRTAMQSEVRTPVEAVTKFGSNWLVSSFEEAALVLRGGPGWSSDPASLLSPTVDRPELAVLSAGLIMRDPPEHTRLRTLLNPAFLPRVIERLRPRVVSVVDSVLDSIAGQDEADIAAEVGPVVALSVMSELLDVGVEGAQLFMEQTPRMVRFAEYGPSEEDFRMAGEAVAELTAFLMPIIEARRREPGDDFISNLATSEGLSDDDILATCILMLTAGGLASGSLIANSVLAMLHHQDQVPELLANPARSVDELTRMEGTSKRLVRFALADHELAGHHITRGELVLVDLRAANQDLRRAPDADQLVLNRKPLAYLTFGNGPHFCLGAGIAQLELSEALVRLFTRFPQMRLTGREPVWMPSTTFRWLQELPVRLR
jgi:cytochrome P450